MVACWPFFGAAWHVAVNRLSVLGDFRIRLFFGGLVTAHLRTMAGIVLLLAIGTAAASSASAASGFSVTAQTPGATPFIAKLTLLLSGGTNVASVQFTIAPMAGSVTRPISATYSAAYMVARGYWDGKSSTMNIPVFGLYEGATNSVTMTTRYSDGTATSVPVSITTMPYVDSCHALDHRTVVVQKRTKTGDLSFDYILLKKYCDNTTPTILDTDGQVRWIGTDGVASIASALFNNEFYIGHGTGVDKMEWDGTHEKLADYASIGVINTQPHNFDPGRVGLIMDADTADQTESTNIEFDSKGVVRNRWDLASIISRAMRAGGDDPSKFVSSGTNDWFHCNATAYDAATNSLIVSSRENFVIALDYDSHAIKWILGDSTKHWYQFKSLRKYALTLVNGAAPPIGQHAVSIAPDGDLQLFDDGQASFFQVPPGKKRTFSTPRAYHIDPVAMTATQTFIYPMHDRIYSDVCGSFYQDAPVYPRSSHNFLLDYPASQNRTVTELVGLGPVYGVTFDYQYPASMICGTGWNAQILHLENLQF
jgi:hypothetical protein